MAALVALADTLRTKGFAAITNSFTTVGNPLTHSCRIFRIINATDADMIFSIDGLNNQFYLPANSFVLYDLATNAEKGSEMFVLEIGTQFYVKFVAAPSKNSVAIEVIYGRGQ
jgi:hypothetical protein